MIFFTEVIFSGSFGPAVFSAPPPCRTRGERITSILGEGPLLEFGRLPGARDYPTDNLLKRRGCIVLYRFQPRIPLLDPVPSSLAGEGEDHLSCFSGFCQD